MVFWKVGLVVRLTWFDIEMMAMVVK